MRIYIIHLKCIADCAVYVLCVFLICAQRRSQSAFSGKTLNRACLVRDAFGCRDRATLKINPNGVEQIQSLAYNELGNTARATIGWAHICTLFLYICLIYNIVLGIFFLIYITPIRLIGGSHAVSRAQFLGTQLGVRILYTPSYTIYIFFLTNIAITAGQANFKRTCSGHHIANRWWCARDFQVQRAVLHSHT